MANTDVADLIASVRDEGGKVELASGSNHYRVYCPDGSVTQISSTPSDNRTIENDRARLRRRGFVLRDEHERKKSTAPRKRRTTTGSGSPRLGSSKVRPVQAPDALAGRVKGQLRIKVEVKPEVTPAQEMLRRYGRPKAQVTWNLHDAVHMVKEQGYSPEHAARMTGYDLDVILAAVA